MILTFKTFIAKSLLTSLLFLSTGYVLAAEENKLNFSTTEVAPGLFMLSGVGGFTGGNIGLSIGDDGVVMIDDSMPPLLDKLKTAISSVSDKPVDFLINTHVHADHIGNNEALANNGTWIVAHKNLRQHLLDKGVQSKNGMTPAPKKALPVITFAHSMNFHLNGYDAHIFHLAHAHTDGDAVIHYKNANVIHTGDTLFNGIFPYIDIDSGGSVDGYIAAQKKILTLVNSETKIIPGHGPLANRGDLESSIVMLEDARLSISTLISEGKTEDQIVEINPLASYHEKWNWGFITTEKMTRQVYKSLQKGSPKQDAGMHNHEHNKNQ